MTPNFEEILKANLLKKNLTHNHIHVAAYTSCLDTMKEVWNAAIEEAYEVDKDAEILKLKIK